MFVDEIKPEETFGLAGGRIAQSGDDVPGRGHGEKDGEAGGEPHAQQMPQVAGERQIDDDDDGGKTRPISPLVSTLRAVADGQSPAGGERRAMRCPSVEQKTVQAKGEPERDEDVGNQDAGVEVRAKGEPQSERGVESGGGVKVMAADGVGGQQQGEHAERQRQARGPIGCAEQLSSWRPCPSRAAALFPDSAGR